MLQRSEAGNVDEPYAQEEVAPEPYAPDEGWWSSVLTEEENHSAASKTAAAKPTPPPSMTEEDWDHIRAIYAQDEVVSLVVHGYNRGGLLVSGDGLQGFVPISHLLDLPNGASDEERKRILAEYVNRTIQLKVIECTPEQDRIVFSERAALAGEGCRKQLFNVLKPGACIKGKVTNITDFGVFVDLGGLEGLIHVSELSWGRVQHPRDIVTVGQEIQALILQISEENSRVALSLKRLTQNPWDSIEEHYQPGSVVSAKITGTTRYGAFARLEEGVEGLIHISSIDMPEGVTAVEKVLHPGLMVQVKILHIDADRRRLGLALVNIES